MIPFLCILLTQFSCLLAMESANKIITVSSGQQLPAQKLQALALIASQQSNFRTFEANSRGFFCIHCGKHYPWRKTVTIKHICKEQ